MVAFGTVDDGLGGGVPRDFLEGGVFAKATPPRKGMAEEVFVEALAPLMVAWADPLVFGGVDVEAGVFPGEEFGEFFRADVFAVAQGVEEAGEETQDLKKQDTRGRGL